jgi:hypothetical protein
MLSIIKLPPNHISFELSWYIENIYLLNFNFRIHMNSISKILDDKYISDYSKHKILFLIYKMAECDTIEYPFDHLKYGGMPSNGFDIFNKEKNIPRGIYHAHISEEERGVLIWYITYNEKGYMVHFEYVYPHPDDDYKKIIKRIYNIKYGWNQHEYKYFKELEYLIKESKIETSFKNFIESTK